MRVPVSLARPYDHTLLLHGRGYENVHIYHGTGTGWFKNLVSHVAPVLKKVGHEIAHAGLQGVSAGIQNLASGGTPTSALKAGVAGARASALTSAQRALKGGGYGHSHKRRRTKPF